MSYPIIVCGIDPGLKGGITFIEHDSISTKVESFVMPTVQGEKKNMIDAYEVLRLLRKFNPTAIMIERVAAMPGQGVTSMFSFGYGAGLLAGVCASVGCSVGFVSPQTWMKSVLKNLPNNGAKSSVVYCQQRFPLTDWRGTERSRKFHDGKTDSCCIAVYGLSQHLSNA